MGVIRSLVLLRGAMGAGKSTFIKENKLDQFVLNADAIRLMFQTPVMTETGGLTINAKHDKKVWDLLLQLLEERMKRGEFTIIDATHAKQEAISRYKDIASRYRYRVFVLDFSDVPLETVLEQNSKREPYKIVPEHVVMNAYERMQTESVPRWVKVIKPDEFHEAMQFKPKDYSHTYNKIHHIGDIQGCYTVLMEYLKDGLKDDELYIFIGDLLDRGIENAEVMKFFLGIYEQPNVIIIEGNHEGHFWRWANDEECVSRTFERTTQVELESAEIDKKEVRQLYRKLSQLVYYTYGDKTVLVTHGGLAKLPDNLMYMATDQIINGVGDYEVDIDHAWDKNVPRYTVEIIGGAGNPSIASWDLVPTLYQIHGHRNIFRLPVQAGQYSFNLEGNVEHGGHLRVVTLEPNAFGTFKTHEIKNTVYKPKTRDITVTEADLDIDTFIEYLSHHEQIEEKDLGDNIFSYNFTRKAFQDKIWDDINTKARGLFINKSTKEIVSRSYNKFFNVNERSFTKISALADNLIFPVQVYDKPNGYLGIVGYNSETDELVFSSKSTTKGNYAEWFKDLFYKTFSEKTIQLMKEDLNEFNLCAVFEVILVDKDPHIIKYAEDKLILLDLVHRELVYNKVRYWGLQVFGESYGAEIKKHLHTFDNWTDFYKWYRSVTEDFTIEDEGFVIEDAGGFMTKIKLPYYNFWKQFRVLKDMFARKHDHLIKHGSFYTPLHNKVFWWMKKQDPIWLKESNIIAVRDKFELDQVPNKE